MKNIRHFAAVLTAVCCAAAFAGCGSSAADSGSSSAAETTTTTTAAAAEESKAEETTTTAAETEAPAEDTTTAEETTTAAEEETPEPVEFDITKVPGYDESATETELVIVDGPTSPWASAFGSFTTVEGTQSDDFIDSRTFQRDKDMHVTVEYVFTDTTQAMLDEGATDLHRSQVVIGPAYANGWAKFGQEIGDIIVDYPEANVIDRDGDDKWVVDGENVVSKDNPDEWAPVFVKNDGFIKITDPEIKKIEFTLPAEVVNRLIDKWDDPDEEMNFDGILFQIGGFIQVTKVTIDQGNVFRASTLAEAGF